MSDDLPKVDQIDKLFGKGALLNQVSIFGGTAVAGGALAVARYQPGWISVHHLIDVREKNKQTKVLTIESRWLCSVRRNSIDIPESVGRTQSSSEDRGTCRWRFRSAWYRATTHRYEYRSLWRKIADRSVQAIASYKSQRKRERERDKRTIMVTDQSIPCECVKE